MAMAIAIASHWVRPPRRTADVILVFSQPTHKPVMPIVAHKQNLSPSLTRNVPNKRNAALHAIWFDICYTQLGPTCAIGPRGASISFIYLVPTSCP